jgi:tyrosyl-tRNA synthetase
MTAKTGIRGKALMFLPSFIDQKGAEVDLLASAAMEPRLDARRQLEYLTRNAAEVVPREELAAKLDRSVEEGRPLRVKLGLDPTAGEVTLGWAVVLRKLREFQDLGHVAVLIVGDFTARVGDPSGKVETRPRLEKERVRAYAERLLGQFAKVVSEDRLEVRYNSEWLEPMDMETVLRLTASYTVARMLERDDFAKRFAGHTPISVMEFLYPLLQAMDSVAVEADVELGGNDQKFNLLVGRDIQREWGQEPQVALTMPLLVGLDGSRVMGQSLGNYVGIAEPPDEMFGKLMSVPDELIVMYLRLCTGVPAEEIDAAGRGLADGSRHPNQEKRRMAREIVSLYHGAEAASAAEERFDLVHRQHEVPEEVDEAPLPAGLATDGRVWLPRLITALGLAGSNSDARRLIEQGGVRIDGQPVSDPSAEVPVDDLVGRVIQVGRRRFVRITAGG